MLTLTKSILVILILNIPSNHMLLFIHPLDEVVKNINEALTSNAINGAISDWAGELSAAGGKALSGLPLLISKAIGYNGGVPILINNNIAGNIQEKFLQGVQIGSESNDENLHITKLVVKYGHSIAQHQTTTSDGYILTMYNMPGRQNKKFKSTVFLMHGLLGSSDDWVVMGPENGLAYFLVDQGYDVWMGNARGNKHSRSHKTLWPSSYQFWDFSWNEIGLYDLPAMIDYVLSKTGRESLTYVGHSQGTTSFFIMCSELPEYNRKIDLMVALSPVAFMSHVVSPVIRLMSPASDLIRTLAGNVGLHEFLPSKSLLRMLSQLMCADTALSQLLCGHIIFLVAGFSLGQMNSTTLPTIMGHTPSGSSVKQLVHYGQEVVSGRFRKFDHGVLKNIQQYGSMYPPDYPVERITAPVALFYSENDWLAATPDVHILAGKLGNVVDKFLVPQYDFNHFDYMWGLDAKRLVFTRILKLMKNI